LSRALGLCFLVGFRLAQPLSAEAAASRLLRNGKVRKYLKTREEELLEALRITNFRTLRQIARCAFYDVRRLFNDDGSPQGRWLAR
jgi:phage terminase small subunit